jgi:hypothetical protein
VGGLGSERIKKSNEALIYLPVMLADQPGYLRKEGLDVRVLGLCVRAVRGAGGSRAADPAYDRRYRQARALAQ